MLERWKKKRIVLREVILAKFPSPVLPLEELICVCNLIDAPEGDFILKASCSRDNKKTAEMKLKVRFDRVINEE
jgi:hypothetical protein